MSFEVLLFCFLCSFIPTMPIFFASLLGTKTIVGRVDQVRVSMIVGAAV